MVFRSITSTHPSFQSGFSLVEIVLALGIMAFALVGILGLFPAAIETAQESKAETRTAIIAQTIISDIRSSYDPATGNIDIEVAPGTNSQPATFETMSIASDGNLSFGLTDQGVPDGLIADFSSGSSTHPFIAQVLVDFQEPGQEFPGLSKIEIRIDYPGAAEQSFRQSYAFLTLISP